MVAQFLEANYDRFFTTANNLILSNNYVTKRQSLKMLGEILLDRSNYNIMTRYISVEGNLKMMMNFLRDKSRNIQYEAFHVFKVSPISKLRGVMSRSVRGWDRADLTVGICGEPEQTSSDRDDTATKQGQATVLPQGVP